ncbi:molybdopterin molybdotransferase [Zhongshania antarctica]|uniref:Molybdopterin molybdenumtransferase n=1 Tax=Zhongshania antarctica TaxID=641702 RepID=A0A840R6C2_9GAMM|nr:gephyrin-like molybdotransferase Glp [Zhongshania antarctica]MBB5188785.1 molybdopterin molybdotransferase [Zhongshania antarctica]
MALRSVAETLHQLLADVPTWGTESRNLAQAQGAILAADVCAQIDVPPLDNSAMDGYALRLSDLSAGAPLRISQRIPAGANPCALQAGTAARIFTGASIPAGADTVVAQEDCELVGDTLAVNIAPRLGQHIRPRGQDIAEGQRILLKGHRLLAADLGLLASLGVGSVQVGCRLRVALMSTGDELREPGEMLAAGQIYNSNRPMLAALIASLGAEVIDLGIVADTPQATRDALARAAATADVVISSGGVSVGEEDHVKAQVEALGSLNLWKLAIKPGKPLAYGRVAEVPFFGLPGNPVSGFVTFCLLVRPYLLKMQGATQLQSPQWAARALFDWPRAGTRQEYLRARVTPGDAGMEVEIHPQQSSGALSSVSWCNALAVIPIGKTLSRGDSVDVIFLQDIS